MGERAYPRIKMVLPIRVFGNDAEGKTFSQLAHTLDFSRMGARLGGVHAQLRVGDEITIEYKRSRSRFTVRWVAEIRAQLGVESAEPTKYIFVELPDGDQRYVDNADRSQRRVTEVTDSPPEATPTSEAVPVPAPAIEATDSPPETAPPSEPVSAPPPSAPAPVSDAAEPNPAEVYEIGETAKLADLKRKLRDHPTDTDGALQMVAATARELLPASGAAIALLGAGHDWICRASSGIAPRVGVRFQNPQGLTGQAAVSGNVVICHDAAEDRRVNPMIWHSVQLRSAASVPIMRDTTAIGVLEVFAEEPDAFGDDQGELLHEIGTLLSELISATTTAAPQK